MFRLAEMRISQSLSLRKKFLYDLSVLEEDETEQPDAVMEMERFVRSVMNDDGYFIDTHLLSSFLGVLRLEVRLLFWEPLEVQQVGLCRTCSRWEKICICLNYLVSRHLFLLSLFQESHQDDSPREAGLPRHPAASRPFLCPCGVFRLCGTFGRDTQYS